MIPKIIHYCWFGGKIPEQQSNIVESWKVLMPDYEFYCWGDEHINEFPIKFNQQAFKKKHYAFVADYFRLRKVYEYGGFYLDTDMMLLKPLDEIMNLDFVICSEVEGRTNWAFFGSVKENKFLKDCFELYHIIEYDQFKPPVIPYFLNDTTLNYINLDSDKRVNLNPDFFYPMPVENASDNYIKFIKNNTIGIHLWDFSWIELKLERSKLNEIIYRIKILTFDFFEFSHSPYYYRINLTRIIRLIKK